MGGVFCEMQHGAADDMVKVFVVEGQFVESRGPESFAERGWGFAKRGRGFAKRGCEFAERALELAA